MFFYFLRRKAITLIVALSIEASMPVAFMPAGFFSFLGNLFERAGSSAVTVSNSQNMALLQAALNFDPNPSKGGGDITIVGDSALLPDSGPLGTIADVEEQAPGSDQISLYVVREGDSLSQIAKMFGVSVNTIMWANDINRGDLIHAGQVLVILPISGVRYTVLKGDTLEIIAKKFKGDVDEIKRFNDIANASELTVGRTIIIPAGEVANRSYTAQGYLPVSGANGPSYVGYYLRPVPGPKTQGLHGYNGVDFAAAYGTPVAAAAEGAVIVSRPEGWNGGYGQYVVVSHPNGTQTLYAHLGAVAVSAGSYVARGQTIGYSGSTGKSTGPHLHFEVRGAQNPFQ
ncbi:MAG: peptidoglycan DD-metalloendopeptidase family protein [Parcubacteria group bacterium]|nr:peptidoglycan DD-metalloendopeptidase family protein [Parcubacteria group bacterium]